MNLASASLLIGFVALILLLLSDLQRRFLPNIMVGIYAVSSLTWLLAIGHGLEIFTQHFLSAVSAFFVLVILFFFRWIAGGDVKLWTAVMLWAGPHLALPVVIITTLSGGILGILGWLAALRLRRNPDTFGRSVLRLISSDRGVPYGVALSIAGLYVIYTYATSLMRLN